MVASNRTNIIGSYDAKTHFAKLLERVESGEELTITRHGTPVARIVPVKKKHTVAERKQAIERIRQLRKGLSLGGLKIRDLINEGRPVNTAFVIDSSVALTWLFTDESTSRTEELLDRLNTETAVIPDWWFVELTNVIALAEKKGRITPAQSTQFIAQISKFDTDIDTEAPTRAFTHLLPLCRTHGLTSYDAIYLDLAIRRQLPLATLDEALRKAAKKVGVKVLG